MKTHPRQTLLFPSSQPLLESWLNRLREVVERIRPCLESMETGQSRTLFRISAKSASVVVVKLSSQPDRCQALVLLTADTLLLIGTTKIQLLHRGQSYEGSLLDPTATTSQP